MKTRIAVFYLSYACVCVRWPTARITRARGVSRAIEVIPLYLWSPLWSNALEWDRRGEHALLYWWRRPQVKKSNRGVPRYYVETESSSYRWTVALTTLTRVPSRLFARTHALLIVAIDLFKTLIARRTAIVINDRKIGENSMELWLAGEFWWIIWRLCDIGGTLVIWISVVLLISSL